jgi:hypothetical protein
MMAIDKRIEVCDKSGSKEQDKSIPWAEPDNKAISLFDSSFLLLLLCLLDFDTIFIFTGYLA